jgi:hypothetical protein
MNAIPYDRPEEEWESYEDEYAADQQLPGRPRRQFFNRGTAVLGAVLLCAAGFYAGVRVEKGQMSSSTSAGGRGLAGAAAASAGSRAAGAGAGARAGGFASLFGGGGGSGAGTAGAGNSSIGTVSDINGNALYVTDASGNTVKVDLSSATKISKSVGVGKSAIRPGDAVVIRGVKNSNGALDATTVSDSGASPFGASSSSGSGSGGGGSTSASSAVRSLFGSGGASGGAGG